MLVDLTPKQADETVNGAGLKRSSLSIIKITDKAWIIVDTTNVEMLCWGFREYRFHIYCPFEFPDYRKAEKWVKSGVIADLQEECSNLDIGFRKEFIKIHEYYK